MSFKEQLSSALQKKTLIEEQTKQRQIAIQKQREIEERKRIEEITSAKVEFSTFLEEHIKSYLEDFNQTVLKGEGKYFLRIDPISHLDEEHSLFTVSIGLIWDEKKLSPIFVGTNSFAFKFFRGEKPFFLPLKVEFGTASDDTISMDVKIKSVDELQSFVKNKLLAIAMGKIKTISSGSDCWN